MNWDQLTYQFDLTTKSQPSTTVATTTSTGYVQPSSSPSSNSANSIQYNEKVMGFAAALAAYSANWLCGPRRTEDEKTQRYKRNGETKVALKKLNNSKNISNEFFIELDTYFRFSAKTTMSNSGWHDYPRILQSYGITKDDNSDDYM
ncbi:13975_t:CDS:2 [Ambispora leptoticha]|uniref:13975_t:CDS:1 n=1 Tax=Ambispora leptoticha TaxID=144679 RepID=A0A9N9A027_9GLOM|nr:13975_t:CDS:2 [Ambispora leptoticha]